MLGTLHLCYFMIQVQMIVAEMQNGWIPLSREEVLDKMNGGTTRRLMFKDRFINIGFSSSDIKHLKKEAIKLVAPQHTVLVGEENAAHSLLVNSNPTTIISSSQDKYCNQDCLDENEKEVYSTTTPNFDSVVSNKRKTKALRDRSSPEDMFNYLMYKDDKPIEKQDLLYIGEFPKEETDSDSHRKVYEVIENVSDVAESEISQSAYTYELPKNQATNEKVLNTTNKFLNILSKYNIKPEDNMQNYILSRQNRVGNSNIFFIPIPLKIPSRFNSLYHLATDPLLAVLLSNYGYYLPGSYGTHNKYRNLYAYLASNNLHNNKPFGSYKIFSDTDSSY